MDKISSGFCPPVMHSLGKGYGQVREQKDTNKPLIVKRFIDLLKTKAVPNNHS